jgi:DNA-directed RNA polymerase subunit M/transcription elongation factor TFIIS
MKLEDVNETKIDTPAPAQAQASTPEPETVDNTWAITDLPSKFKLYSEGTKLVGRPLKVLEVKKLATMDENNVNQIINDIVRKTIKGIDIQNLLIADKLYLVFWLRANTYRDSGYQVSFKCGKCGENSTYNFSLNSIKIRYIDDDYNPEGVITLPVSKDNIVTKFLRVKDEEAVDEFKSSDKILDINDDVVSVAASIEKINDKTYSLHDRYMYLVNAQPADYAFLESAISKNDVGINPIMNVKCNKCKGVSPVGVTFRSDFFIPDYTA